MVKRLAWLMLLSLGVMPEAVWAAKKDLVILHSERWIDTIKGTVKNMSADRAEEVVIVVRFYGDAVTSTQPPRKKPVRAREMGQQSAKITALDPGQEAAFEVEIIEKYRKATSFKFEPRAVWHKAKGGRSHGKP